MNDSLVNFLFHMALILFAAKSLGILMRKLGLPQVLGFIIAGILVGPAIWGLFFNVEGSTLFPILKSDYLGAFAEIGVIFVMFTAGLETNINDIKKNGLVSFLIAGAGVLVPLGLGIGVGAIFMPSEGFFTWLFVGVIMTATSVGIVVEVLRELGKLNTKVGTIVLSASIIDDVLGIIILSVSLSISGGGGMHSPVLNFINPNGNVAICILWILGFFVFAIGAGFGFSKLFKLIEKKTPHTRRIPILSIALCVLYAFIAEKVFGVADITGAYIAGLVLSTNHASAQYVDRKVTISSYTIFAPMFFANIGINMSFSGLNGNTILFSLVFVLVAILAKFIGCGSMARVLKFSRRDSLRVGIGMIARGEVALIVTEKGIAGGLLPPTYRVAVVFLVVVTSILSPIILKLLYKKDGKAEDIFPIRQELEEGHYE